MNHKPFGQILRELRLASGVGLRELSSLISKSPGYISDVELGRVPPPSEEVIINIADALQTDKNILLGSAKKIDPEIRNYVAKIPRAATFLRMAKDQNFNDDDWERLAKLAELSRMGGKENRDE